jgi:hypothetical protein
MQKYNNIMMMYISNPSVAQKVLFKLELGAQQNKPL